MRWREIVLETVTPGVYYHATFTSNVPKIMKDGLIIGKRRVWSDASGSKQGLKAVYLFSDPVMAVRWAHKMQYDFDKPTSILVISDPPGAITPDDHVEAQMNGRSWFHTDETVPPTCIKKVVPLTLDLTRAVVAGQPINLLEGREAPLYHYMTTPKAMDVFVSDVMPARWEHDIPGIGKVKGNSFSRNARFNFGDDKPIRLVIDQAKLAQRHKIVPLDAEIVFRHEGDNLDKLSGFADRRINNGVFRTGLSQMAEEFALGDIKNLHTYIVRVEVLPPNFHYISGYNAFKLDEAVRAYCEKFNLDLVVSPKWTENLEEIKERWAEDDEDDGTISEAAPSDTMRGKVYYHGTGGTGNAKAILKQGLQPPEINKKGQLVPVKGRVYMTDQLRYAIIYALGGDYLGSEPTERMLEGGDPYGYVFSIDGSKLQDVQPDEDSVGEFMADHYRALKQQGVSLPFHTKAARYGTPADQVFSVIWNAMTETQRRNGAQNFFYAAWAAGGKRALKNMPEWMKVWLIDHGMAHVAHGGSIMPDHCWRIDRRKSKLLAKDGSNFFEIAKKVK